MPTTPNLEALAKLAVSKHGGKLIKNRVGYDRTLQRRFGEPGSPDLIGDLWGRPHYVEVKGPRDRLHEHQRRWLDAAAKRGALAGALHSVEAYEQWLAAGPHEPTGEVIVWR